MSINRELFKKEALNAINGIEESIEFGLDCEYDRVIERLNDVIISSDLLMQKDFELGRLLRLDKIILVAKHYQIMAYEYKMENEPEHREKIAQEMIKIAKGYINSENPYFVEITEAMEEWKERSRWRDFYTNRN